MPKRSGKFYNKNEKQVMESLGLKPTIGSGAGWIEKEDGENEYILAQLKSTDSESINVKLLDIHKLEYHAITSHKIPVFVIEFLRTGERFIMAKPADLPSIAQYLNCGACDIIRDEDIVVEEEIVTTKKTVIKSSSKAKDKFWSDKTKEWEDKKLCQKKLKSR
jgi:hypothetical protein